MKAKELIEILSQNPEDEVRTHLNLDESPDMPKISLRISRVTDLASGKSFTVINQIVQWPELAQQRMIAPLSKNSISGEF